MQRRHVKRRAFLAGATSGVVVAGAAGSLGLATAKASTPVDEAEPVPAEPPSTIIDPQLGLHPGMQLGPVVVTVVAFADGALRVEGNHEDERVRLDVLRRGHGPEGVASTSQLAIYVCNGGDGQRRTEQIAGLAARALAKDLGARRPALPLKLMDFRQRRDAFPGRSRPR